MSRLRGCELGKIVAGDGSLMRALRNASCAYLRGSHAGLGTRNIGMMYSTMKSTLNKIIIFIIIIIITTTTTTTTTTTNITTTTTTMHSIKPNYRLSSPSLRFNRISCLVDIYLHALVRMYRVVFFVVRPPAPARCLLSCFDCRVHTGG